MKLIATRITTEIFENGSATEETVFEVLPGETFEQFLTRIGVTGSVGYDFETEIVLKLVKPAT